MTESGWSGHADRERDRKVWVDVLAGFAVVMFEHGLVAGLLAAVLSLFSMATGGSPGAYVSIVAFFGFGIGLTQLSYVLPTFLLAMYVRRTLAAGVALGALVTFLLNGACFGALCATM